MGRWSVGRSVSVRLSVGRWSVDLIKPINISNFVEKSVSFSEEIRTVEEKVTCIFSVAATSTKWIQCILEVIFELMFI